VSSLLRQDLGRTCDPSGVNTTELGRFLSWGRASNSKLVGNKTAAFGVKSRMDRKLQKREQEAIVVLTLGTATLLVCFTYALSLI
jgi:hypothetical protein